MTSPQAAPQPVQKKKTIFSPRNLINVGVFTALAVVIGFASGMLGLIGPGLMWVGFLISVLANAVVIMLFIAKTPYFGALTIVYFIYGLILTSTGHPWYTSIAMGLCGLLGDIIASRGHYRNKILNAAGYSATILFMFVGWAPLFLNSDAYFAQLRQQMGEEWMDRAHTLVNPGVVAILILVLIIIAFPAALWAQKLLKKHFAGSGIM